jgi:hypothetical protein
MPSIGLVLLAIVGAEPGNVALAVLFAVLAGAIVAGLLALLAQERWAVLLGRLAAAVAQRLRREADPDQWSQTVVEFRSRVSSGLPGKLARSMVALILMVIADATILTLAIRFTGIGPDVLPLLLVVGTFCTEYPLPVMPLFGFGVLTPPCWRRSPRPPGSRRSRPSSRRSRSGAASRCSARWCSARS